MMGLWLPDCSAAALAHSSAYSIPAIPLWAGHHRISMVMSGFARRSAAICFRTWMAYCCPGPGSSDAICLIAACASEKMVTSSGVAFLCATGSSACARAAHSAS